MLTKDERKSQLHKSYKRLLALRHQIGELLGPNPYRIEQYESASCLAEGIYLETTYQVGIDDGFKLTK